MIIKSEYLKREFDVETMEMKNEDGSESILIRHNSIHDIITNKVPEQGIKVNYKDLVVDKKGHFVFICSIIDKLGRSVKGVGEAVSESLARGISATYPITIAQQRAFDKAASNYLAGVEKVIKDKNDPAYSTKAIASNYLNKDVEITLFEGKDFSKTTHESLENVIHNDVPVEKELVYEYEPILLEPNHIAFTCVMKDNTGREICEIGELLITEDISDFEKTYPVTIAIRRAFDRAAIKYLDLPAKVYSDVEIPLTLEEIKENKIDKKPTKEKVERKKTKAEKKEEDVIIEEAPVETEEIPAGVISSEAIEDDVDDIIINDEEDEIITEEESEPDHEEDPVIEEPTEDESSDYPYKATKYDGELIDFGKFDKKTFKEVVTLDGGLSWIAFVIKKITAAKRADLIAKLKNFVEEAGIELPEIQ